MLRIAHTVQVGTLVAVLLLLPGCVIFSDANQDDQTALDESRSLWEGAGIADYSIRFQRMSSCIFCDPSELILVRLTIRGGVLEEVIDVDGDQPVTEFNPGIFLTVAELFVFIQDAIDQQAAEIDITYDQLLGYPTDITVDFSRRFFDDELGFQVREFAELQ